jgi:hypothetical protein
MTLGYMNHRDYILGMIPLALPLEHHYHAQNLYLMFCVDWLKHDACMGCVALEDEAMAPNFVACIILNGITPPQFWNRLFIAMGALEQMIFCVFAS